MEEILRCQKQEQSYQDSRVQNRITTIYITNTSRIKPGSIINCNFVMKNSTHGTRKTEKTNREWRSWTTLSQDQ